jgi:hypothetical protein
MPIQPEKDARLVVSPVPHSNTGIPAQLFTDPRCRISVSLEADENALSDV